jgi:CubicO group peptidase (beta-lactamase class C family)
VTRLASVAASVVAFACIFTAAAAAASLDPRVKTEVPPETVGLDPFRLALVDSVIERALADGASPGAALVVGRHGRLVRLRGYGRLDWAPFAPFVTDSTLFDLASLTKAMGSATVAAQLVREGRLDLDLPIHDYLRSWPGWGMYGLITARHLLAHTSGLPPGTDLWPGARSRDERIASLARLPVRHRPGTYRQYSDVGMILLGAVLEAVTGSRLDDLLQVRVFEPLAMRDTRFNPLLPRTDRGPFTLAQIAPTELDLRVRRTLVHGVVHDLNAWALDGVAGHAGLFSSARDMAAFGQALLDATGDTRQRAGRHAARRTRAHDARTGDTRERTGRHASRRTRAHDARTARRDGQHAGTAAGRAAGLGCADRPELRRRRLLQPLLVRAHGLHGHEHLDRPGARHLRCAADEPAEPVRTQPQAHPAAARRARPRPARHCGHARRAPRVAPAALDRLAPRA